MASYGWLVLVAAGPVVLGLAVAFGLWRRGRISARERMQQKRAVEDLYSEEEQR
jgi:hypothetical protein